MADFTESVVVPAFFIHTSAGTLATASWFLKQQSQKAKSFGIGFLGYGIALTVWTIAVLVKPDDLKPWVLVGVIPFLLASFAFVRSAVVNASSTTKQILPVLVAISAIATFIFRTFIYESHPYFSNKGLFYFGLDPTVSALYIITLGLSFVPAALSILDEVTDRRARTIFTYGFLALFTNAVVMLSTNSDTLGLINGIVLTVALIGLWTTSISKATKKQVAV